MADSTSGDQPPAGVEGENVSRDTPTNEAGLQFWDLIAGAQVSFVVPDMPPIPRAIGSLKERCLRQRAEAAWNSAFLLQEAINLWGHFLLCGYQGTRIDPEVEDRIGQLLPDLAAIGGAVNALARDVPLPGDANAVRQTLEKLGIKRGPTRRHEGSGGLKQKASNLWMLIQQFSKTISTHAHALHLAGVKSQVFEQPWDSLKVELSKITRIDFFDFDGSPPCDFGAKLSDRDFLSVRGKIINELVQLLNLLKTAPTVLLRKSDQSSASTAPGQSRRRSRLSPEEMNIAVREYLLVHPNAKRDEISEKLGIAAGSVSNTPSWKAVSEKRSEKKGKSKPRGMKKVGLEIAVEELAKTGFQQKNHAEEELPKLIADQEADRLSDERPRRR